MKEAQMHLINKMFNDKTIRTVWNKEEENMSQRLCEHSVIHKEWRTKAHTSA